MPREVSDSGTLSSSSERMDEPETEDFLAEVVQNSIKTKKRGYRLAKPGATKTKDDEII